jgi:hypothetical protein
MTTAEKSTPRAPRADFNQWGLWAERAVVRALDLDPNGRLQGGLLGGQSSRQIALTIARAIGYLAGTQRAPELPTPILAWLDQVAATKGDPTQGRRGGLSWKDWPKPAAEAAFAMDRTLSLQWSSGLRAPVWQLALLIVSVVADLAGRSMKNLLPDEVASWIERLPRTRAAVIRIPSLEGKSHGA